MPQQYIIRDRNLLAAHTNTIPKLGLINHRALCQKPFAARIRLFHTMIGMSLLAILVNLSHAFGATLVSGNVSGTWTSNGSPYILTADSTVPVGTILTIQAGSSVIIGPELILTIDGQILAVGNQESPISFQGANPNNYWDRILLNLTHNVTNRFNYCSFKDARTALYLRLSQVGPAIQTNATEIVNCRFSNCREQGIYGLSQGLAAYNPNRYWTPHLNPSIRNCRFSSTSNGCTFLINGYYDGTLGSSPGYASPTVSGNIFESLAGVALDLRIGTSAGYSTPRFINNTVVNVDNGVRSQDPYDAIVKNNIFVGTSSAVQRSGNFNLDSRYNCFFGNTANFTGYPPTYGQILLQNNNGDPCDLSFNIFLNPAFADNGLLLANTSPCVDAGEPMILDSCFPPSRGSATSDIGAYGGASACDWHVGIAPTITLHPQSQSSCLGQTASFSVEARGSLPVSYQWYFNGAPINGQIGTNLILTGLQGVQAGSYSVAVSNAFGGLVSDSAQLVVFDACIDLHMYAGINISGQEDATYELRYTTDLNNTNFATWTSLGTNTMRNTNWFYLDKESPFAPKRFYGVKKILP